MSGSFAISRTWLAAAALAGWLAASAVPAAAADGSGTNNPALLRGTYGLECGDDGLCLPSQAGWPTTRTLSGTPAPAASSTTSPGNCATLAAAGIASADCAGVMRAPAAPVPQPVVSTPKPQPVAVPLPPPPAQVAAPPPAQTVVAVPQPMSDPVATGTIGGPETPGDDALTGDWRIALRGSSVWDEDGQRFVVTVGPEGELTVHRVRGEMRLSAGFGLSYEPGDAVRVETGTGALEIDQALARSLMLKTSFQIDVGRDSVDKNTDPTGEKKGAQTILGEADAALEYSLGRAGFTLGGTLSRQYVGDTGLNDGTSRDNTARNWSGFGLRARTSFKLTPILSAFVAASANRAVYDAVNTGFGAPSDNWTYRLTGGLDGQWSNGLTASLYGGYGVSDYDSDLIASGGGYVIGGSLSYPVLRGGEIAASLDTNFTPTDSVAGATTEIAYSGELSASYLINDWLTLRGALGGSYTVYPGAKATETGLTAGAGIDWQFGPHTALNADYAFGANWADDEDTQSHTVSLGMTVSR